MLKMRKLRKNNLKTTQVKSIPVKIPFLMNQVCINQTVR